MNNGMIELAPKKNAHFRIPLSIRKKVVTSAVMISIVILSILWIIPMVWMLSTAFKPESQVVDPIVRWIPKTLTFENYIDIFSDQYNAPILRWCWNSLFIATTHTALVLFIDSLASYAYSRLEFKGRNIIFWILMSTMMIPPVMNFIPNYVIVDRLGWVDTPLAMIVPGAASVFGIFLLRQFFEGIPKALDEAARVDGASMFKIYSTIILPLSKPALMVLGVFTFMANWNDFLWPLIVTNDTYQRTLQAGMQIFQGVYVIEFGKLMAGASVSAIVPFLIFLFGQKYLVKGIAFSGLKG